MRHQQINFVNVHTLIHTVLEFVKGLIAEKLRSRFVIHSNVDKLQRTLPVKILPKEYGGVTPIEDMIGTAEGRADRQRERWRVERGSVLEA